MGRFLAGCGILLHVALLVALGGADGGTPVQEIVLAVQILTFVPMVVRANRVPPSFWALNCLAMTPLMGLIQVFYPGGTLLALPLLFMLVMLASTALGRAVSVVVTSEAVAVAGWSIVADDLGWLLSLVTLAFVGGVLVANHVALVGAADSQGALVGHLERAARYDSLTGALSRAAFDECVDMALHARRSAERQPVSLLLVDIDHFKLVNDTYGHASGDAALAHVADLLRAVVRAGDGAVGRIGGDEFAVLLDGCPLDVARRRAEELAAAVTARPLVLADGTMVPLSVSVGVSGAVPVKDASRSAASRAAVYSSADQALYRAKNAGRARAEAAARPVLI